MQRRRRRRYGIGRSAGCGCVRVCVRVCPFVTCASRATQPGDMSVSAYAMMLSDLALGHGMAGQCCRAVLRCAEIVLRACCHCVLRVALPVCSACQHLVVASGDAGCAGRFDEAKREASEAVERLGAAFGETHRLAIAVAVAGAAEELSRVGRVRRHVWKPLNVLAAICSATRDFAHAQTLYAARASPDGSWWPRHVLPQARARAWHRVRSVWAVAPVRAALVEGARADVPSCGQH